MTTPPPAAPDEVPAAARASHRDHRVIQIVLQIGMYVGGALMLAGVAWSAIGQIAAGGWKASLHDGHHGDAIMRAGILTLAFTPVVSVASLVWMWLRKRDWRFAAVGGIVLAVLIVSMLTGRGG